MHFYIMYFAHKHIYYTFALCKTGDDCGSHLVEQLLGVVIKGFMGKHAFVVVDTLAGRVKQLAGKFT